MTARQEFRPDNSYLKLAALLFLFFILLRGGFLLFVIAAIAAAAVRKTYALSIDAFYVSLPVRLFSNQSTILQRERIRAYMGKRKYGSCLILSDKTSVQEIVLYGWAYKTGTLSKISSLFNA